ncbi:UNKNOWN [Stylonychia lemnae]|uniref:TLDc domain-containing protein n=1 Tax=Stylonychia lemnae TaxID=5949 RepID=A0A078B6Z1_STYLE|nr:UNKNOWN [Stylonychia lemnae]|eukprot:CDW89072.1 UNKNOWN [Stylonychia lemnae]
MEKDRPNYLEFRRLIDFHLEQISSIKTVKNKLLPITGETNLIYKASRDGYTASSFHQKCDNQGPTISFILSEPGQVFGGYTSISWTSPGAYIEDAAAFIFNLTKNSLHNQYQNFEKGVIHNHTNLMIFGRGHDIFINNNCNYDNAYNTCDLGGTYMPPQGLKFRDSQAQEYLAGTYCFKVIEIEVYQVKS